MKTRIYTKELKELAIEIDHSDIPHTTAPFFFEREYKLGDLLGDGYYKEIFVDGFFIGHGDIELSRHTTIHVESDMDLVEMHFSLGGYFRSDSKSLSREVSFQPKQHNILYANGFKGALEWSSRERMKVFEVSMSPAIMTKYLPEEHPFDFFKESLYRGKADILLKQNYSITPQMISLIHKIINCDRIGQFKRMFLEANVIELLMLQLEQIAHYHSRKIPTLNKRQTEQLHAARDILVDQLNGDFTLNSLAEMVGTNSFTLKNGFKELFGTTVFRFWNELKMQEAKKLLIEGELNVYEVSAMIGYKNQQHFSTAFKKHFGYSPRELKR